MLSEAAGQATNLDWLLAGLVQRVPHTRSAVLLSSDGLAKAAHGLDDDGADQLAAIACGLFSLARSAAGCFGASEMVRQVVAELDDTLLFVSTAGCGAVLAVLAARGVDAGVLGYEMSQLVKSARPYLTTPARQPIAADKP
ncbi:roadblock/LC7 domain-containing protein [Planosporangium mesophilum]|uniref:Dynein regulation protein LC7 n=1 Tax=Planosporangium mesophilum TaxID=689768 RepID=A0A8J3TC11_9ACTN|nr:roadblock/LC7 domain-containing protein [Planosporangium mesophilum]NJC82832.1 roadblock/LC7 domain-containing protein [Planosporangium mesophilum]GII23698.1 dynein regulation protein LC7 [Planosporangium mesophilum]